MIKMCVFVCCSLIGKTISLQQAWVNSKELNIWYVLFLQVQEYTYYSYKSCCFTIIEQEILRITAVGLCAFSLITKRPVSVPQAKLF